MSQPRVTILMTVYNGGTYLRPCLESILRQSLKDFELLIINDGSTDDSLKAIEYFDDRRIRIYHNAVNQGQTKSLNIGLQMAAGEYVARMDADDIAFPHWLEAQVHSISQHPDCSVISSYAVAIDDKNRIKKLYKPPSDRKNIILRSLIASPVNHVGSILRKKDIIENGGYEEHYAIAADYALWSKLLRNNFKMTTTPRILVAIREHAQSLSRSERGKRELEEITQIVQKNIDQFVATRFLGNEVALFCRANYDEEHLTPIELKQAVAVTKRIYMNLAPFLKIGQRQTTSWARRRCTTIYIKKIFSLIRHKDYKGARGLAQRGIKELGPFSILTMFWVVSFLSRMVTAFIPPFYHAILRIRACLRLNRHSTIGFY